MKQIIYLLILCVTVYSCTTKTTAENSVNKEKEGTLVKISQASRQSENFILNYSGLTEPVLTVPLSFQLPGTVEKVLVDEGDQVRKGQVLAILDQTTFQSAYNAALASQTRALDAYERLKKVYDNGSLPEIKWQEIKSQVEQANSSAQIAKKNLENCKILAPVNGTVGSRNIEAGATATPGISVFNIITTNELYARISVPENEINKIKPGQQADVTFPALGEGIYIGEVEKVAVIANTISKTFEVKIRINNPKGELRPGTVCNVNLSLNTGNNTNILVPVQAVQKDAFGKNYLYLVAKNEGIATRREVQTAGIINNQLCITSGLNEGEYYVVEGQQKLSDNSKVNFN